MYSQLSSCGLLHRTLSLINAKPSAGDKDGDGGVIKKDKKSKAKKSTQDELPAKCCVCEKKWDRYVGKKKCYTCGVPGKSSDV